MADRNRVGDRGRQGTNVVNPDAEAAGEREPGLTAIAAPIRSSRGELEAIAALQGPSSRFDATAVQAAVPLLLERASTISRELGWNA